MTLDSDRLPDDPFDLVREWIGSADPPAMALATASADGQPSVRMVLLRGIDERGMRFYTDRRSRKGRDIGENPRAAAVLHWPERDRQLRVHGRVELLDRETSAAYWATRPAGSRISATISRQGEPVDSRGELESRAAALAAEHPDGDIPLPLHWGGYRIVPDALEFWVSRADRLHDRIEYRRTFDGGWERRRLQP